MAVMQLTLLLVCASCVCALYDDQDNVDILTDDNFESDVMVSSDYWVIEFYAPWCGHCQKLAPEWKKAALALKDVARVGAIDCDVHKELCGKFGVEGFPTIKTFGADKSNPEDFKGGRDADAIVSFVKDWLGPGAASSKLALQVKYLEMYTFLYFEKQPKVLLFTEDNKLPSWYTSAAMKYKDGKKKTVSFAHVRPEEKQIVKQFKLDVLPALLVCLVEKDGDAVYYQLPDDISSGGTKNVKLVKEFVDSIVAGNGDEESKKAVPGFPPPDIHRKKIPTSLAALTHENINSVCFGHKHPMCLLGLLGPEIDPYKSVMSDLSKKFRNDPFSFVYADVSRQTDFLAGFGLTAAELPAAVLVKLGKRKRFAVLEGFEVAGIKSSLDNALGGGMQFKKLAELPELLPDALLDSDTEEEAPPAADEDNVDEVFGKDEV